MHHQYNELYQFFVNLKNVPTNICNNPAIISMLFQRCLLVDTTSGRRTKSNHCWNNVAQFNFGICNVEQFQIIIVYYNVEMNNVTQRRNKIVISNVKFDNADKRWNNAVKMTISKKTKKKSYQIEYTEINVLTSIS